MAGGGEQKKFSYLPKILNGGFAGIVGVTCVFPIDLVKTRLQNQRVGPDGKAQYSGMNLSAWRGMIAGGAAGFCQIIVTTPMELLKIQMQDAGRTNVPGVKKLTATQLTINLLKEKGIAGLYRGLGPTMARDVTFSVIYFPLFAQLDSLVGTSNLVEILQGPRKSDGSGDAVFWTSFVSGLASGAFSSFAVTPLDVIKTRIQLINQGANEVRYKGITDAFVRILRQEGPKALFKGAACRMLVMAPLFGIAQTVYYIGVAEYFLGIKKDKHV